MPSVTDKLIIYMRFPVYTTTEELNAKVNHIKQLAIERYGWADNKIETAWEIADSAPSQYVLEGIANRAKEGGELFTLYSESMITLFIGATDVTLGLLNFFNDSKIPISFLQVDTVNNQENMIQLDSVTVSYICKYPPDRRSEIKSKVARRMKATGQALGRRKVDISATLLRSYLNKGMSHTQIARELGVSRQTILNRKREFGFA